MKLSERERDRLVVNEYVTRARATLPDIIRRAYWFGSRARGQGRSDSDYDLLIETTVPLGERERDALADIAVDLAADRGALLDVHFYSMEQLADTRVGHSPLVQTAYEEGVEL